MEYRVGRSLIPVATERPNMNEFEFDKERPLRIDPAKNFNVSRAEFDALVEQIFRLNKTVEGVQLLLGKAAEYQGKPRGRLTR